MLIWFLRVEEIPRVRVHRSVVRLSVVALRWLCRHLLVLGQQTFVLVPLRGALVGVKHRNRILNLVTLLVQLLPS